MSGAAEGIAVTADGPRVLTPWHESTVPTHRAAA